MGMVTCSSHPTCHKQHKPLPYQRVEPRAVALCSAVPEVEFLPS